MKQSAHINYLARTALTVVLTAALALFSTPIIFAFADEVEDAQAEASSSEAAQAQEETPSEASEQASAASEAAESAAVEEYSEPVQEVVEVVEEVVEEASEDDKEKEEKEESKELTEAKEAYEKAQAKAESAAAMLGDLGGFQAALSPYFGDLAEAAAAIEDADGLRAPLDQERNECLETRKGLEQEREEADMQRAEALYRLALTDREMALATGVDLLSVVVGVDTPTAAEVNGYFMERVAATHAAAKEKAERLIETIDGKIADVDAHIEEIDAKIAEIEEMKADAKQHLEQVVGEGNVAAFAIEKLASEARHESKLAIEEVEKLDSKVEGVDELKKAAQEWDLQSNSTRSQALDEAGQWYDAVDALVSLEDGISYGCGLDFALSEDDFVAKWGPAIDAFFAAQGAPLQGYGDEMARQAYSYKVDPRLCAAVSIVESSGGRYCIKPHNAWGWGAADSDPYNLASAWGSWEEAIESWHRGMATSQTGLATTPSLTAMGDIYCSSPIWGSKVATLMESISGNVETQQVVYKS